MPRHQIIATCSLPGDEDCEFRVPVDDTSPDGTYKAIVQLKMQLREYFTKVITNITDENDNLQQDAVEYSEPSQSSAEVIHKESEEDDGMVDSRKRPKTRDT